MSDESAESKVTSVRTKDYRLVYANTFRMRFGDNDVLLSFGHDEVGQVENHITEEVCVAMTPRTAKQLAATLARVIENFEREVGPIILPDED